MRALSLAGMDGEVLGNHEFDLGAKNLFEKIDNVVAVPAPRRELRVGRSARPRRSARCATSSQPYQIFDVDGLQDRRHRHGQRGHDARRSIEGGNSLGFRPIDDTQRARAVRAPAAPDGRSRRRRQPPRPRRGRGPDRDRGRGSERALPLAGRRPHPRRPPPHRHEPAEVLPNDDGSSTARRTTARRCSSTRARSRSTSAGSTSSSTSARTTRDPEKRSRIVVVRVQEHPGRLDDPRRPGHREPDVAVLGQAQPGHRSQRRVRVRRRRGAGAKILRNDPSRRRLAARQPGRALDAAAAGRRGRVRDHQLARHPRRLRARPADDRADVQRVPVREHDHRDVPVGQRGAGDARLRRAQVSATRGCRTQAQVAGIYFDMVCKGDCPSVDPITGQKPTACAKNIYLGDNCRGGNPDGPVDPTQVRAARRRPASTASRSTTTSPAAARASRAQAQHLASRTPASRCATRSPSTSTSRRRCCDGMSTDMIVDDTDTQTRTRTVKARWGDDRRASTRHDRGRTTAASGRCSR